MVTRIVILILLAGVAQAQTLLAPTNTRASVVGNTPTFTLTGPVGSYIIQYTTESSAGVPINVDDGSTIRQYVYNSIGHLVQSNAPSTVPMTSLGDGQIKFVMSLLNSGTYAVRGVVTPLSGTNDNWNFTHHWLVVTQSAPSASSTITINQTNNITSTAVVTNFITVTNDIDIQGSTFISTNIVTVTNVVDASVSVGSILVSNMVQFGHQQGTNAPAFVRMHGGNVLATGVVNGANLDLYLQGGQGGTINGVTSTAYTLTAAYPLSVTNYGDTFYFSFGGGAGLGGVWIAFTNAATFAYSGTVTQQFIAGATVSQVVIQAWGAGAAFGSGASSAPGSGGYTEVLMPVTNAQVLNVIVPQGGIFGTAVAGTTALTARAFGGGGAGVRTAANAGGGGGAAQVWFGTNLVLVAGGAGSGSSGGSSGGAGGGISGAAGSAAASGLGGTQTEGGAITAGGTNRLNLAFTNTPGSFLQGGDGGVTNAASQTSAGGGGGGYYGGGGGFAASGGGGSGYYNTNLVVYGVTIRGTPAGGNPPPGAESPYYPTGYSPAIGVSSQSTNGGHGYVVIRYP